MVEVNIINKLSHISSFSIRRMRLLILNSHSLFLLFTLCDVSNIANMNLNLGSQSEEGWFKGRGP